MAVSMHYLSLNVERQLSFSKANGPSMFINIVYNSVIPLCSLNMPVLIGIIQAPWK